MPEIAAFAALFPLSLGALALAYVLTVRVRRDRREDEKGESAFGLGQAAIFGLIALILGFSFAFATERFEARRALVVREAGAIGSVNMNAAFLPAAQQAPFRKLLVAYTQTRLESYAETTNDAAESQSTARSKALYDRLWSIASKTALRDPRNQLTSEFTTAVDAVDDISEEQAAALDNHVPVAILALVIFSTLAGAVLLGMTFGRANAPNAVLSIVFCLLCAATVFTIIDLDDGKQGFIRLETAPLQATLDDLQR